MDPIPPPHNLAKQQYTTARQSLTAFEERVVARYWDEDAPVRASFGRLLGSLDMVAGWLLADDEIYRRGQALLRTGRPASAGADIRGEIVAETRSVDVTFTLPAEVQADSVALCGEFNQWSTEDTRLERGSDGTWRTTIALAAGHSYRYRYLLDGERWENAWQADRYEPNPYGGVDSVVVVELHRQTP
jgi:hypothetical protein